MIRAPRNGHCARSVGEKVIAGKDVVNAYQRQAEGDGDHRPVHLTGFICSYFFAMPIIMYLQLSGIR